MEAPTQYLKQAKVLVDSLKITVVFGQKSLRMTARILGKTKVTVLPVRIVEESGHERRFIITREGEETTHNLTLDNEMLIVRSEGKMAVLTRESDGR